MSNDSGTVKQRVLVSQTVRTGTKSVQRRSVFPWFVWLLVVVAGAAGWLLYFSHWFVVTQVKVLGVKRVHADQVSAVANSAINQALIKVDLKAIHDDVAKIAEIQSVSVQRGWPHTVLVKVVERTPIAVASDGGKFVLVDNQGLAAGPLLDAAPKGFGVIAGAASTPGMAAAVQILQAIPSTWKVSSITGASQDSVVVTLADGSTVTFGSGDQAKQKVKVAEALLANKYTVIDVSAPDAPAVRK